MATFTDTFTRADGTTNGVNGWTSVLSTWNVLSNQLQLTGTHNTAMLLQTGTPMATPDHSAEVRVVSMVSTFGPIVRSDGTQANFYMLRRSSSTAVSLYKMVGGAATTLAIANITLVAGDLMKIQAVGTTIKGFINGVEILSFVDSSLTTGVLTGIRVTGTATNAIWDDFSAADVSTGPVINSLFGSSIGSYGNASDAGATSELGLRFNLNTAGKIHGVRFYKLAAAGPVSPRTGRLWVGGSVAASAVFSGETASGWQEVLFATPYNASAGVEYIVSYNTNGEYPAQNGGFNPDIVNNGIVGLTGVFAYPAGNYPGSSFEETNYYVDVLFEATGSAPTDTTAPTATVTAPTANQSLAGASTFTATATDSVGVTGVTFEVDGSAVGSATLSGGVWSLAGYDTTLLEDGDHVLIAKATDAAGNIGSSAPVDFLVSNAPVPVNTTKAQVGAVQVTGFRVGSVNPDRIYLGTNLIYGTAPVVTGPVETGTPTRVASYGANGTHWPARTPWKGTTTGVTVIEVACTWAAISAALAGVTDAQANAGTIIKVQPGTLVGTSSGGTATATPVLSGLGNTNWTKRVLVYPRDGYGTVLVSNQVRYLSLRNVTIAGLKFSDTTRGGWLASDCTKCAFAWTRQAYLAVYSIDGAECSDVDLCEVVNPLQVNRDSDIGGLRTGDAASSPIRRINMYGCYLAPSYKVSGSAAHCDTWQHSGQGGNVYEDFFMQDSMIGGATNSAIQIGSANNWRGDNVLVVGSKDLATRVWPMAGDRATNGNHAALNGEGTNMQAKDCIFIGGMGSAQFISVENSKISYGWTGTGAGLFTNDPSLMDLTKSQIDTMAPIPDDTRLATIWA